MRYNIKAIKEEEIVSLAEVKNFLRIEGDDDNELLKNLMEASINMAETHSGLMLGSYEVEVFFNFKYAPDEYIELDLTKKPVKLIKSITCDGKELEEDTYRLENNKIIMKKFGANIRINYLSGMDKREVPATIKIGILMHISNLYEKREGEGVIPANIMALYKQFRFLRV